MIEPGENNPELEKKILELMEKRKSENEALKKILDKLTREEEEKKIPGRRLLIYRLRQKLKSNSKNRSHKK